MSDKIGLVLSGGGAKGAYEVGVYKALSAMGADEYINIIAGTSVGALNAVLFESRGAEYSENIWRSLKISDMFHLDRHRITKLPTLPDYNSEDYNGIKPNNFMDSLILKGADLVKSIKKEKVIDDFMTKGLPVTQERIGQLIDENIDFNRIYRNICVVCSNRNNDIEYFKLNSYDNATKKKIILASSALPGIYTGFAGGVEINGQCYFDGGITSESNTPVSYVYDNGYRSIIAVHLRYDADLTSQYRMKDADIVNIIPSKNLGSFFSGTINLNPQKVQADIELGYNDTINKMGEIHSMINKLN
ncbi:MAG: patatin-like phospholipase family protein [Ruminococcus sp.]|nr:patatin-like phospholipase family protein [Ruminococcus sp.]